MLDNFLISNTIFSWMLWASETIGKAWLKILNYIGESPKGRSHKTPSVSMLLMGFPKNYTDRIRNGLVRFHLRFLVRVLPLIELLTASTSQSKKSATHVSGKRLHLLAESTIGQEASLLMYIRRKIKDYWKSSPSGKDTNLRIAYARYFRSNRVKRGRRSMPKTPKNKYSDVFYMVAGNQCTKEVYEEAYKDIKDSKQETPREETR